MNGVRTATVLGLLVVVSALLLGGCAGMSQKFSATPTEDVGVFADQTISMLANSGLGFSRDDAVYIRDFVDLEGAEEQQFIASLDEVEAWFRGIIRYSLTLVTLVETKDTEAEQVAAYADFMAKFDDEVLEKLEQDPLYYADLIEEIRQQEEFRDALLKGQPIINASGRYIHQLLNKADADLKLVARKLDRKIDERYAEVIRFQRALEAEKYAVLRGLGQLYQTIKGDPEAFEQLRVSGAIWDKTLIPAGEPSYAELKTLSTYLMKRLDGLHVIEKEIQSDWQTYRATLRELDEKTAKFVAESNRARVTVLVWVRAHQKMASGRLTPAEWFDINEAPSTLIKLGTKAIL